MEFPTSNARKFIKQKIEKLLRFKFALVEKKALTAGTLLICLIYFLYSLHISSNGDSGGPLMRQYEDGHSSYWYLTGLVSYGPSSCGMKGWPGVYTRVSDFK